MNGVDPPPPLRIKAASYTVDNKNENNFSDPPYTKHGT